MQISVAMCTYNGAEFLRRQLESIKAQTRLPIELVVCDDGSSDTTHTIVEKFSTHAPFTVRFVRNQGNLGSTKNFEQAIHLCQGDLIALCDQDDIWLPEKLKVLAEVLEHDPSIGGVFSNAYLIDETDRRLGRLLWSEVRFSPKPGSNTVHDATLLQQNVATGATLMIRSTLRSRVLPIDPVWVHDGWIAWMINLYSRLCYVSTPLIEYRVHSSQQVGLTNRSIRQRLERAREIRSEPFDRRMRQFEVLRDFWKGHPGEHYQRRLKAIGGAVSHAGLRATLPEHRIRRFFSIAANFRGYHRYSFGLSSMARDFLR